MGPVGRAICGGEKKCVPVLCFSHITSRLVALIPSGDLFVHAKDLFVNGGTAKRKAGRKITTSDLSCQAQWRLILHRDAGTSETFHWISVADPAKVSPHHRSRNPVAGLDRCR